METHWWSQGKTVENEAQTKSQGQNIRGVFHARQVHIFLQVEGGDVTLRWHTLSRPCNRGTLCKKKRSEIFVNFGGKKNEHGMAPSA